MVCSERRAAYCWQAVRYAWESGTAWCRCNETANLMQLGHFQHRTSQIKRKHAYSSELGFRPLCRSLVQSFPWMGCSLAISRCSTSVLGLNASNGWSRKKRCRTRSSKYTIGMTFGLVCLGVCPLPTIFASFSGDSYCKVR